MTTNIHLRIHGDTTVRGFIEREIRASRLRDHLLLRDMIDGELHGVELRSFVSQYRYFVAKIPWMLADLVDRLPGGPARDHVAQNLEDELLNPTRLEIYDDCAASIGAPMSDISSAMMNLVATYDSVFNSSDAVALAALLSHECQSPDIARAMSAGLRSVFGVASSSTRYWDLAIGRDARHSRWLFDGINTLSCTEEELRRGIRIAISAWCQFFDEQLLSTLELAS
jgi:pyrroloquinoline quinone (PQQ) biosynthesis protein C